MTAMLGYDRLEDQLALQSLEPQHTVGSSRVSGYWAQSPTT